MPRALILVLGFLTSGLGALGLETPVAHWTLTGPSGPVVPGQPFTVQAEVRLPPGYYQDADSPFLLFEPGFSSEVTGRSSSLPATRAGKTSFTGTFTLSRTLILPSGAPVGDNELRFTVGWQICQVDGVCLLPVEQSRSLRLTVTRSPSPDEGFAWGLLGAFLGGLLLNLMPCVFPVLALKALGLASSAGLPRAQRRREALAFAAGGAGLVVALGLATATLAALGHRLDWGFPFQQPGFVWFLVLVFGALALPLLGIGQAWSPFSLTRPVGGGLGSAAGSGAFLVLAAAPCTAPLLGPALGFALTQPPAQIPWFFVAIGLGLVTPLLVLQAIPDWGKLLPRPGRWMVAVERVAGVLLVATAAYLVWVFVSQAGQDQVPLTLGLLGATGLAWGLTALRPRSTARWLAVPVLAVSVVASALVALPHPAPPSPPMGWQAFSAEALAQAQDSGRPVFVDATAAWCATCQVNEWAILNRPEVIALLDQQGVVRLRADYTRPDPAIQRWLGEVGRAGLPVYALYRPGKPVYLFSELLTDETFTRALPGLLAP